MKTKILITLLALVIFSLCGCGKKALTQKETEPFKTAIVTYLKQNDMEMKVAEFKSLTIAGDTATCTAAMQEAEDLYDLKVTWGFTFHKDKDGWKAISYKTI
ncbi:hypothetical protein ACFLS1_05410 [Verrucomicrobiota bacterium]